jgi:asparagine synthase (glutamine-hydrolysing)
MCGIIGICGVEPVSRKDRKEVEQGAEWMRLRGPDDSGFIEKGGICFGHRRLAILDPESGQQPWVDPETGAVLVFNGELFNFWELREQLVSCGIILRTQCDTELLMQAYRLWGRGCLEKLNGMFAFALYDPRKKECWLVRDRLGVKPLYYSFKDGRLRFASSMKGLFAFGNIERKLDLAAVSHYLRTVRTSLGRRTLIKGVCSLQPGEELLWEVGTSSEPECRTYWALPPGGSEGDPTTPSFEDACKETFSRVEAAVKRQMISDVPLGGFLSGGLDSSILSYLASKLKGSQFGTFSVGYDADGFNEWASIRENVRHNQLLNEEIHLEASDYRNDWQWLISEKGLPLSTPNEVPIYRLAKAFGTRYKVALSGEGADEVFGGYIIPTFCAFDWDRMCDGKGEVEPVCFQNSYGVADPGSRQEHFFRVNSWLSAGRLEQLFDPAVMLDRGQDPVEAHYRKLFAKNAGESTFSAYLRVHAGVNLEGLLSRLDTSTMAASVEGRVPFADHSLVEWLFKLPDAYKMKLQAGIDAAAVRARSVYDFDRENMVQSKRLLRGAFSACVPEQILQQRKVSFPVPFGAMFQEEWRDLYQSMLLQQEGPAGLLRKGVPNALAGATPVDPMLAWPMVNLFLWQQEFSVDFSH